MRGVVLAQVEAGRRVDDERRKRRLHALQAPHEAGRKVLYPDKLLERLTCVGVRDHDRGTHLRAVRKSDTPDVPVVDVNAADLLADHELAAVSLERGHESVGQLLEASLAVVGAAVDEHAGELREREPGEARRG